MRKQWTTYLAIISFFILAVMVPIAGAYDTTSSCDNCHGSFRASTYSSLAAAKAANPAWPGTSLALHNGHANSSTATPPGMLNGNCNACHFGSSRTPVYTYQSSGTAPFNQGCSGCHDGPGLRAHHVNSGAATCYDCHSDPAPAAENVLRPVYAAAFGTTSGTTRVNDPCNPAATGFEGRLKDVTSLGLDNDGNLMYDQSDPACAPAAAKLSVSPTTLTYGNQAVGTTSATQTVTISNTGTAVLNVTALSNSNTTDYVLTAPAVSFSVAAAGSQTFTLAFRPASSGAKNTSISITSNGGNSTVNASGTGVAPVLSVSPATLTFGNQTISTTSAAQTLTLSNTGTGTLNVTGITSSNAEFAFSPASISPIAAGGSATLSITFTPAASGARSSNINILSNGGNATVSASGTGIASGALSVAPATLTYANQTVGTTSVTQTVTVSNTGGSAITLNSITNSNTTDFVLAAPVTPLTINGGASQTFTLAFRPGTSGAKTATITVASSAGNATVSASGTGVTAAALSVSPATLTYANQTVGTTSATQTVTVSNTGGSAITVTSITNSNTTDFVLAAPVTPLTINGGASQTFTLAFRPGTSTLAFRPGTSGAKTATITVASSAGNATVSASGTGATAAALSVSPATLTYANQTVGTTSATQTVTVSNTSGSAITLNSITNSNTTDFVLAAPVTPLTINGGASQTFTLAFRPGTSGAKTATITVASSAGNATVSASGTGVTAPVIQPVIAVSPLLLTFSNVTVNTTASKTITISNTGNAPLSITQISKSGSAAFSFSPTSFSAITAGASATFTVTYAPAVIGTDPGATININSNGGNASVSLTGNAVLQPTTGSGDVALVKLTVPGKVTARVSGSLDINVIALATTTNREVDATVTLTAASDSNVKVSLDHGNLTEELKSNARDPRRFDFKAKIACTKEGTWPVTWTAKISSKRNSNTENDTLTGVTQVTCSSRSSNIESDD